MVYLNELGEVTGKDIGGNIALGMFLVRAAHRFEAFLRFFPFVRCHSFSRRSISVFGTGDHGASLHSLSQTALSEQRRYVWGANLHLAHK